ncbi:MAG: hypothetical protein RIS29_3072 [Bacteroidota bacterium]|jgi:hypothetical protein
MKLIPVFVSLFVIVFLFKIVLLFLPFQVELQNNYMQFLVEQLFPLSVIGCSLIILFKSKNAEQEGVVLALFIPGVLGFGVGFVLLYLSSMFGGIRYQDANVSLQSQTDPRQKVLVQYLDEGAWGSHYREVYVIDYGRTLRISYEFSDLLLHGKWVKFENEKTPDTIYCDNTRYHSELNVSY